VTQLLLLLLLLLLWEGRVQVSEGRQGVYTPRQLPTVAAAPTIAAQGRDILRVGGGHPSCLVGAIPSAAAAAIAAVVMTALMVTCWAWLHCHLLLPRPPAAAAAAAAVLVAAGGWHTLCQVLL
jgi:hypothetical protein